MFVINASKMVLAQRDEELKRILYSADLVTADGMSVVWASHLFGSALKERITGIDTLHRLVDHAAERGYSVYFLGATNESLLATVEYFRRIYPDLKIAGYHDGYFRNDQEVIDDIRRCAPDILFVGMGSPAQEKWLSKNLQQLGVPFSMGVGGSFDHIGGRLKRAPLWMQRAGLEWLFRLLQEPRRLWKRYLIGNSAFIWIIIKEFFSSKKHKSQ